MQRPCLQAGLLLALTALALCLLTATQLLQPILLAELRGAAAAPAASLAARAASLGADAVAVREDELVRVDDDEEDDVREDVEDEVLLCVDVEEPVAVADTVHEGSKRRVRGSDD
jgi:hypothetical protein